MNLAIEVVLSSCRVGVPIGRWKESVRKREDRVPGERTYPDPPRRANNDDDATHDGESSDAAGNPEVRAVPQQ